MSDYVAVNRSLWDGWTDIHAGSAFYDVDGFRAGALTLKPIERERVGDVAGKELLHLQCHFGLDTLSWARLGARVTGVDFSLAAIRLARSLAAEQQLDAQFVCASALEVPLRSERYDIVFTSYGVLPWLPDLRPWAAGAARCTSSNSIRSSICSATMGRASCGRTSRRTSRYGLACAALMRSRKRRSSTIRTSGRTASARRSARCWQPGCASHRSPSIRTRRTTAFRSSRKSAPTSGPCAAARSTSR